MYIARPFLKPFADYKIYHLDYGGRAAFLDVRNIYSFDIAKDFNVSLFSFFLFFSLDDSGHILFFLVKIP